MRRHLAGPPANIYRQKFDAYYGKGARARGRPGDRVMRDGTRMPTVLRQLGSGRQPACSMHSRPSAQSQLPRRRRARWTEHIAKASAGRLNAARLGAIVRVLDQEPSLVPV